MNTNHHEQHLNTLSILHYVFAAMVGLFAMFPIIHLIVGILIVTGKLESSGPNEQLPVIVGWMFIGFASAFIIGGFIFAVCVAIAGRRLKKRSNHLYCMIIAGFCCIFMPIGTALGVFTLIVLMKPEARALFGLNPKVPVAQKINH